jgi:hypothetical protein
MAPTDWQARHAAPEVPASDLFRRRRSAQDRTFVTFRR